MADDKENPEAKKPLVEELIERVVDGAAALTKEVAKSAAKRVTSSAKKRAAKVTGSVKKKTKKRPAKKTSKKRKRRSRNLRRRNSERQQQKKGPPFSCIFVTFANRCSRLIHVIHWPIVGQDGDSVHAALHANRHSEKG